jgi:hypothetical protein
MTIRLGARGMVTATALSADEYYDPAKWLMRKIRRS